MNQFKWNLERLWDYITCIQRTLPQKLQKSPVRKIHILVRKRILAIFSSISGRKSPKYCLAMQPPTLHRRQKTVWPYFEKQNLAGNLTANFGAKIQTSVFPVCGIRSLPNFTIRRSLGTCTRRTNPHSIISNRSKVIQEKRFSEIAKIGFLRSEGHKIPKAENPRDTVPPASYPNSICAFGPNLKKICNNVFERGGSGATH